MPRSNLILSLAKVLVAAAWADGELSNDEINCLKDLLFRIPGMTASDWAVLDVYIDEPVRSEEWDRLLLDLQREITTPSDRALALQALQDMAEAENTLSEGTLTLYGEIIASIRSASTNIFSQLGKGIASSVRARSRSIHDLPEREKSLEDFVKNRIYYKLNRLPEGSQLPPTLSEAQRKVLSLAGGLLARVAHADREVGDAERSTITQAIHAGWDLPLEAAEITTDIAVSVVGKGLDYYRLSREFFLATNSKERVRFLDVLFQVAAADGEVTHEEVEEIRSIARGLKLTHKQFISAKLRAAA